MTDVQTMPIEAEGEPLAQRAKGAKTQNKNNNNRGRNPRQRDPIDPNEPVVKPTQVAKPDETEHNAKTQALKDKIAAGDERITKIEEEIEGLKLIRNKQNAATKELAADLRAHKDKVRAVQAEKDAHSEQLELLSERRKQAAERNKSLRKTLETTDPAAIDSKIAQIQRRLETETTDLKTEKDLVYQIKKLTGQKDSIKDLLADQAKVKEKEEAQQEMYLKFKAKKEELAALRAIEREKVNKLDAARAGAVEGEETSAAVGNANAKIVELLSEKADVITQNKQHRAGLKEVSVDLKIKMAEYREYQRAMASYQEKMEQVEYAKRRAEQQERYALIKEERKEKDKKRNEDRKRMEARMLAVANGCQVYVGGLGIRADEGDLRLLMEPFGTLTDVSVVRDNDTELSRGFSFVTFENEETATKAIKELNRKEVAQVCPPHGRLTLKLAEKSRQQKEWEKANASKIAGKEKKGKEGKENKENKDKENKDSKGKEKEKKVSEEAAAAAEEAAPIEGEESKGAEAGEEAAKANGSGEGAEGKGKKAGKKQWEATRKDWKKDEDAAEKKEEVPTE